MASGGIFAIKMEAEVSRLFVGPPLEQRGAIVLREHAEGSEIDGRRRLDGGDKGRSVVGSIGIVGGRGGADGDVDGHDGHTSDAERADGAGNGGGPGARPLRTGSRRVGNLRGQRIADSYALGNRWAGVGNLEGVSKVGALVHRLGRRCFDDADVGLPGQSDGNGGGRKIVGAIRILGSGAGRVIYVSGVADYRACWRRSREWPGVYLNYQWEADCAAFYDCLAR